jgi:hypothetical protein
VTIIIVLSDSKFIVVDLQIRRRRRGRGKAGDFFKNIGSKIKGGFEDFGHKVKSGFEDAGKKLKKAGPAILDVYENLAPGAKIVHGLVDQIKAGTSGAPTATATPVAGSGLRRRRRSRIHRLIANYENRYKKRCIGPHCHRKGRGRRCGGSGRRGRGVVGPGGLVSEKEGKDFKKFGIMLLSKLTGQKGAQKGAGLRRRRRKKKGRGGAFHSGMELAAGQMMMQMMMQGMQQPRYNY